MRRQRQQGRGRLELESQEISAGAPGNKTADYCDSRVSV